MGNSNILFLLRRLCAVWRKNFLHWHITFAKCFENLPSTIIVGYESVGNMNKIQAICVNCLWTWRTMTWNNLLSLMVDRMYVFNLFKLGKDRSQTALVAGANSISLLMWQRFSSKYLRQICRGVAIPKGLQRLYLLRGCDNSFSLELEQVT